MLPTNKRSGNKDESANLSAKGENAKPSSVPPPLPEAARGFMPSVSDEEMTHLMPVKALGASRPLPKPLPSSRPMLPPSSPPPRSSARPFAQPQQDDENDELRTMVRGAPKIIRRTRSHSPMPESPRGNLPTTVNPSAVIKATLESARAGKRPDNLMPPPPADLLEDLADLRREPVREEQTKVLPAAPVSAPPSSYPYPQAAPSQRQVPPWQAKTGSNYPGVYDATVAASSVGAVSLSASPAHFAAPPSDARFEPGAMTITSRARAAGRPAMSWVVALLSLGLLVGVGGVAAMNGSADGLLKTSASFVDPSRAPAPKAAAVAAPAAAPEAPIVAPGTSPVVVAPVVNPPAAAAPQAPTPVPVTTPEPAKEAKAETKAASAPAKTESKPAPVAKPATPPAPVVRAVRPAAAPKPAAPAEDTVAAAPAEKPAKPAKGAAASKGNVDEETRKALETLQKSQLDSASF